MITSICMNPAFDKTVEVDTLTQGATNRIRSVRMDMGGKGINVAVVAKRLGMDALCIGCMGEDGAGQLTALMNREGLPHRFLDRTGSCAHQPEGVLAGESFGHGAERARRAP